MKIVRLILSYLFLLKSGTFLFAQVTIEGTLKLVDGATFSLPATVKLGAYKGGALRLVDSTSLSYNFNFKLREPAITEPGVYEIIIGSERGVPLVISTQDTLLEPIISWNESEMSMNDLNEENTSFHQFNTLLARFMKNSMSVLARKNNIENDHSMHNDAGETELLNLRRQHDSLQLDYNRLLKEHINRYPQTYTSKVLARLTIVAHAKAFDPDAKEFGDLSWIREHFFDSIPYSEPGVANNHFIDEKITSFLSMFGHTDGELIKAGVSQLIDLCPQGSEVRSYVIDYLSKFFLERGPEEVVLFIYNSYVDGCQNSLPELTMKRMRQVQEFVPGFKVPELILPDLNEKSVSLSSCLHNGVTMVYFWASWCDHCKIETPKYHELYTKFKSKGFSAYAVSLDSDAQEWKKFIETNKLTWINVSDLKGFDSEAAKKYFVYKTPSILILNSEGRILEKELSPERLEIYLQKLYR